MAAHDHLPKPKFGVAETYGSFIVDHRFKKPIVPNNNPNQVWQEAKLTEHDLGQANPFNLTSSSANDERGLAAKPYQEWGVGTLPMLRVLGEFHGNRVRDRTECWEQYADDAFRHVLMCGHVTITRTAVSCGSNCRPHRYSGVKGTGPKIECMHEGCVRSHEVLKRNSHVFAPKRPSKVTSNDPRGPFVTGNREFGDLSDDDSLFLPEDGTEGGLRRKKVMLPSERTGPFIGSRTKNLQGLLDKALPSIGDGYYDLAAQNLLATTSGSGNLNGVHHGFSQRADLESDIKVSQASKLAAQLRIDGTERLKPGAIGHKAVDEPTFALPDREFGGSVRPKPAKRTSKLRRKMFVGVHSGMFSVPETTYAEMRAADPGSATDLRDSMFYDQPEVEVDHGGDLDVGVASLKAAGKRADGSFVEEERFCICRRPSDQRMLDCTECGGLYHPECIGKAEFATVVVREGAEQEAWINCIEEWYCSSCNKVIYDFGYRCQDCMDVQDLCGGCYVTYNSHDQSHRFEFMVLSDTHAEAGKAFSQNCKPADTKVFTCLNCDRRAKEAIAAITMGRKNLGTAELRAKTHRKRQLMKSSASLGQVELQIKKRVALRNASNAKEQTQIEKEFAQVGLNDPFLHRVRGTSSRISKPAYGFGKSLRQT